MMFHYFLNIEVPKIGDILLAELRGFRYFNKNIDTRNDDRKKLGAIEGFLLMI